MLEVHEAAEAEEPFAVLLAVESSEHAGEIVCRSDAGAEAPAERLALRTAAEVVPTARARRRGNDLELARARFQLEDRLGQVAKVERLPVDASRIEVSKRVL